MFYKINKVKTIEYVYNDGYKRNTYRKGASDLMVIDRWEIKQRDRGRTIDQPGYSKKTFKIDAVHYALQLKSQEMN
jgi:hypothetical protein